MSIIYSYPEQGALNADDLLIGTSVEKVGGKQKNITRNFSVQQIANFINRGVGFVDPVATDFQIPVFNQGGLKITGSIMSQDSSPSNGVAGGGITVAGTLTTTQSLTVGGGATIGNTVDSISLNSPTSLLGSILDSTSTQGGLSQILVSNQSGKVNWVNYEAGLTYEGTWDAANNTINGTTYSPALLPGIGNSGHFYIVNVQGTTSLGAGLNDWHVGDWAVFLDEGTQPASWQKIDNTSALNGTGTDNKIAMWTGGVNPSVTLTDSLISQAGAVVSVDGSLNTNGSIGTGVANYDITTSATNQNLRVKGNGTGGLEVRGETTSNTDGKIILNCSVNTHGVTLQSPPHPYTSYTLVLPTSAGTTGQTLTTAGGSSSQLTWTSPLTNVIQAVSGPLTSGTIPIADGTYSVTDSIMSYTGTVISVNGDFSTQGLEVNKYLKDGAGSNGTDGQVLTSTTSGPDREILWVDSSTVGDEYDLSTGAKVGTSVPLNLTSLSGTDNSIVNLTEGTGITLTPNAAGNEITIAGSAQGVTSVTGTADRIAITGTASVPIVNAVTGTVNSSSLTLATGTEIQAAIDLALTGALTFKGTFNAATGAIIGSSPTEYLYNCPGGAGTRVAVTKGDLYIASTGGAFYCDAASQYALNIGDEVIATLTASADQSLKTGWSVVPSQSAGGSVTNFSAVSTAIPGITTVVINPTTTPELTLSINGGSVGQFLDYTGNWSSPGGGVSSITFNSTLTASTGDALSITPTTGAVIVNAKRFDGDSKPGVVTATSGDSANFLRGDGQWAAPTSAVATKTVNTFIGSLQNFIDLSVEASGVNYIDMYIDGVYQAKATYTIATPSGTGISRLTLVSGTFPTGVSVETVTTT